MQVITEDNVISIEAFTEGRIIVTGDYAVWRAAPQVLVDYGMQSLVFLPIKVGARTLGLVTVIFKKKNAFAPEVVDLLTSVVEGLGNLLEISILQDESKMAHHELERLTEELSRSNQQINQSNQLLEERVKFRTQELETVKDQAVRAEKLAIIEQLSGGIPHDLRNPLGVIKNAAHLIQRKFDAERTNASIDVIGELLGLIDDEVERAEGVISNLLSFASNGAMAFSQTDIGDVINDSMTRFVLRENIDLAITVEPDLPQVLGDASQLIRTFQNLVANAQDAMENGGRLSIVAQKTDGSVEIVISDTGIGIDSENINRIFDPLYSGKPDGTGMALAICHEIITNHNGSISVRSQIESALLLPSVFHSRFKMTRDWRGRNWCNVDLDQRPLPVESVPWLNNRPVLLSIELPSLSEQANRRRTERHRLKLTRMPAVAVQPRTGGNQGCADLG